MSDDDIELPFDWCRKIFGRHNAIVLPEAPGGIGLEECAEGPPFRVGFVDGHEIDVTPAPIWVTNETYLASHIDIVLGRPQPDSPTWLTAAYIRECALQPGNVGISAGVVPIGYLDAIVVPTDFNDVEAAAQAAAETAFNTGQRIEDLLAPDGVKLVNKLLLPGGAKLWPSTLTPSPLASLRKFDPQVSSHPISIQGTLTNDFVYMVDRSSMPILAAARALALRDVYIRCVYI
jgi:hypothetical protein